jgi:hypothetical protein
MFLVIILCYHLLLSSEKIRSPFFFPEDFSHSVVDGIPLKIEFWPRKEIYHLVYFPEEATGLDA